MSLGLSHRGPDAEGFFVDEAIALGHRRLSILDLSDIASQPMVSRTGKLVLSFNGEIYNHRRLRGEIDTVRGKEPWRSSGDTETLLAAFETFGIASTLTRLEGMFAIALYDRQTKNLTLARDRLGEKPLYFGMQGDTFLFASEPQVFYEHVAFSGEIDAQAAALFFRHSYVPAPYSIFRGIRKLLPGQYISIDLSSPGLPLVGEEHSYWSVNDVVQRNIEAQDNASEYSYSDIDGAADALEKIMLDVVGDQMEADVPIGAFLSGGIDSSLIVALMQAQSDKPVRTFTIGFDDKAYDESQSARSVAAHLGTEHKEQILCAEDVIELIPRILDIYSEPFSDSSQIPTFLVSSLARQDVTIALSGDGGDELFCGYNRYLKGYDLWNRSRALPGAVRHASAFMLNLFPPHQVNSALQFFNPILPKGMQNRMPGEKLHKFANVLAIGDERTLLQHLTSQWHNTHEIVGDLELPLTALTDLERQPNIPLGREWMMAVDAQSYLPDDIMVKVDRATMAVSLESRAPFLNHRVFEFARGLPLNYMRGAGEGKAILRKILKRHLPPELFERPKMGFGIPLGHWLRGPLRDWADNILVSNPGSWKDNLNQATVEIIWAEHLSGRKNHEHRLWSVLIYRLWLKKHHKKMANRTLRK